MLIQTATIARKLQRALRLQSLPDSVLAAETVPVILVEDLSAPLSEEERGCIGQAATPAVAAEFPIIVLVRAGDPSLYSLVVTEAFFHSTTTQVVSISIPTAAIVGLTVSAGTSFEDLQLPGRPASFLGQDTQVASPAARPVMRVRVIANEQHRIPLNFRLGTTNSPLSLNSIMIIGENVNTIVRGGFKWTEGPPLG